MKKSLIAMAMLVAVGAAMAHDPTITGSANVSGAISNTVSASSFVNGPGSSVSGAGSSASSAATAYIGDKSSVGYSWNGWKGSIDTSLGGNTDTKVTGYAYNVSSGSGSGAATASGWSDAGSAATITGKLYGNTGTIITSGSLDTGKPTNRGFGPDVAVSAGTNQAVAASAVAGGDYGVTGHVESANNYVKGVVGGAVSDVKSVTTYANASKAYGNDAVSNLPAGFNGGTVNVLNAGSKGTSSATGNFQTSTGQLGSFTGTVAPVFTNTTAN